MSQSLAGRRIFVVEDDFAQRNIIQTLLEYHGAEISTDDFGTAAMLRLRHCGPVDLILLDLSLPNGINGFELAEQIREMAGFRDVPILALSSADPDLSIPLAQASGMNGFIPKPLHFGDFPRLVANAIDGDQVWDPPEARQA